MQGQLADEPLTVRIQSECAHCGKTLTFHIDSEQNYQVEQADASPLVFVPLIDFEALEDPSIIDAF